MSRSIYGAWVDMDELDGEEAQVVGADMADETVADLREINRSRPGRSRAQRQRS